MLITGVRIGVVMLRAVLTEKTGTPGFFGGCLFFFVSYPEDDTDRKTSGGAFSSVALRGWVFSRFWSESKKPPRFPEKPTPVFSVRTALIEECAD